MKAVILAGGFGTRLKPITDKLPKPMVEVAGKPILEHILDLLKDAGINEFIFALCYLPDVITKYFGDGTKFDVKIDYSYENPNHPLGTAGAVKLSKKLLTEDFIVTSGDTLRKLDVKAMLKLHQQKKPLVTLNAYKRFGPDPKSMLKFNDKHQLIEFVERPTFSGKAPEFVWSNGFFYICQPKVLTYIPKDEFSDLGKDIFPKILESNEKIMVYPSDDYFVDIGNIEKLNKAKANFS